MRRILRGILSFAVLGALLAGAWFAWESWRLDKARSALMEVVQSTDLDALLRGEEPEGAAFPPSSTPSMGELNTPTMQPSTDSATKSTPLESAPNIAGSPSTPLAGTDTGALNPVDLALRNILLSQGEQGLELWRLQAHWATLRQESGLVEVRDPNVRYALGEPKGERDGKPYFDDEQFVTVTSRTGKVTNNNSRITLEGDVRSEYQGDVLTGPVAEFDNASRVLLYTEGATLEGARLNGFAQVLRWNMATNTLDGEQGVTLIWTPEPKTVESAPNITPTTAP